MSKYSEAPCYKPQGLLTRLRCRVERLTAPQRAEDVVRLQGFEEPLDPFERLQ